MIKLKPGDYVSTEDMTEAQYHAVCKAFMDAGANKCEYGADIIDSYENFEYVGWCDGKSNTIFNPDGIFHFSSCDSAEYFNRVRKLTISQILGGDNAEGP